MSLIADILTGRAKLAYATVDPAGGGGFDGGGMAAGTPAPVMSAPPAPMAPAPVRPAPVVPKNTPATPPQPTTPGLKSGALHQAIAKTAILGLAHVSDFARGASSAAEDLLTKNITAQPDQYATSLQTQMPDRTLAMPNRGIDIHAAALSALSALR